MNKISEKYKAFDKAFKKVELMFCAVCILFVTALVTLGIILKNIFNFSFPWTEELCQYVMVWVACIGGVISVEKHDHVSVDIIYNILPKKIHAYYKMVLAIISTVFLAIFAYYSYLQVVTIKETARVSVTMPWFQMWWMYLATLVGCALMSIEYFKTIFVLFKEGKKGISSDKNDTKLEDLEKLETM